MAWLKATFFGPMAKPLAKHSYAAALAAAQLCLTHMFLASRPRTCV